MLTDIKEDKDMTRKRWRNLMIELCRRVAEDNGKHIDGKTLAWYRDKDITTIKVKSYAEGWEMMKPVRNTVGM